MDKIEPGKDAALEEVTRESLIAISYSVPDQRLPSSLSPENVKNEKLSKVDNDEAHRFRTELISISNSQSFDIQGVPDTLGELKG